MALLHALGLGVAIIVLRILAPEIWSALEQLTLSVLSVAKEHLLDRAATPEEKKNLERAASLSKIDLVTAMVYEFPELQGVMGNALPDIKVLSLPDGEDRED